MIKNPEVFNNCWECKCYDISKKFNIPFSKVKSDFLVEAVYEQDEQRSLNNVVSQYNYLKKLSEKFNIRFSKVKKDFFKAQYSMFDKEALRHLIIEYKNAKYELNNDEELEPYIPNYKGAD
jgi:hypothetical protein